MRCVLRYCKKIVTKNTLTLYFFLGLKKSGQDYHEPQEGLAELTTEQQHYGSINNYIQSVRSSINSKLSLGMLTSLLLFLSELF